MNIYFKMIKIFSIIFFIIIYLFSNILCYNNDSILIYQNIQNNHSNYIQNRKLSNIQHGSNTLDNKNNKDSIYHSQDIATILSNMHRIQPIIAKYEKYPDTFNNLKDILQLATYMKEMSYDPGRLRYVSNIYHIASGIYVDTTVSNYINNCVKLKDTIMILVVDSVGSRWNNTENSDTFRTLLQNYLCFSKHYGYKTIVYLIENDPSRFENEVNYLKSIDKNIYVLDYPYELFWSLIVNKREMITLSSSVHYQSAMPSFKEYGFITMLVPILEALKLGYNVVYFDVDIAFVKDPIPNLLYGNSDFIVSTETRDCAYHSISDNHATVDYSRVEPNTGMMYIKSTSSIITLVYQWFDHIIQINSNSDQRSLNFRKLNAIRMFDCNPFIIQNPSSYGYEIIKTTPFIQSNNVTYCYLNELIFQVCSSIYIIHSFII